MSAWRGTVHGGVAELVATVVALLLVAAGTLAVAARLRLPFSVALVLVGVGLRALFEHGPGSLRHLSALEVSPEVILFVFLPTLVFESAFELDGRVLRRNLQPILALAVPGLLVSTLVMGGIVALTTSFDLPAALLLAAILSATDPVAVVALFRQLGAPTRLSVLVEGESLFNDATAIVAARILTALAIGGAVTWTAAAAGIVEFVVVFTGGVVVGVSLAVVVGLLLGRVESNPFIEISLTTVLAYLSFLIAEEAFHVSGVMATVSAALTMGGWGRTKISPSVASYLGSFWEYLAFVANALIFLLVGLQVDLGALGSALVPLLWVVLAMLVSRAAVVLGLLPLVGRLPTVPPVEGRYRAVMYWGGLRGAIALAIALSLPASFEHAQAFVVLVAGAVLFTLLVQAPTMEPLVHRLGLDRPPLSDRLARLETDLTAKRAALGRLPELQSGGLFGASVAGSLREELRGDVESLRAQLDALRGRELDRAQERRLLQLRCLATERASYHGAWERGHLSERALRDLSHSVQLQADALRHGGGLPAHTIHPPGGGRWRSALVRLAARVGLQALAERARRAEVAREYEQAWGRHRGSLRVLASLEELARSADVRPDVLEEVRVTYRRWERAGRERIDATAEQFPEFVADMQQRLASRLVVQAEREVIERERTSGAIPIGAARSLLDELDRRLRGLRGRSPGKLSVDPSELLRTVPFFREAPAEELDRILAQLRQRTEPAGSAIITQGEEGESLFLVARGVVRVCREVAGEERELATLMAGDFFGEMALLHGERRVATCRTVTPCALYELRKRDLDSVSEACPAVQRALEETDRRRRAELEAREGGAPSGGASPGEGPGSPR